MPLTTAAKEGIFSALDDIAIMVNTLGVTTPYDLNGDGTADLVLRNTSAGVVAWWLMNGTTRSASGFFV
jgi:hypothetical protein